MMKLAKTCFIAALAASATLAAMAESAAAKSKVDPKSAEIVERMKAMRLPEVRFKPPNTIIDAVWFFREVSKKYDNPKIPKEKRGFNCVLRLGGAGARVPTIPNIWCKGISFYDALKMVCDSIDYIFVIEPGPIVMIMSKEMPAQMERERKMAEKAEKERIKKLMPKGDAKSAKVVERMKAMRLPAVRFKPPKTIVDAVEFFREASKKCDNPNIPKEKRGFKIILRTGGASVPEIPNFSVTNISFYEALELVCKVIEYEFSIIDGIVIVKPRGQGAAAM